MHAKLEGRKFTRVIKTMRTDAMLDSFWHNFVAQMDEIKHHSSIWVEGSVIPRNITPMNCKLCNMRDFCHPEMDGESEEYLLGREFMKKEGY